MSEGQKSKQEKALPCRVLTPFTTLGWGMLQVCKMRLWERLADNISGVAGLMPKRKWEKRRDCSNMEFFWCRNRLIFLNGNPPHLMILLLQTSHRDLNKNFCTRDTRRDTEAGAFGHVKKESYLLSQKSLHEETFTCADSFLHFPSFSIEIKCCV